MDRLARFLMGGILITTLLLQLSIYGLWQTDNPLYLLSLTCCLCTLGFMAYHLVLLCMPPQDSPTNICLVVVQITEPETFPDPLYAKVRERM
jgi:hypothetical protein